jgi:hypothetical protein
MSATLLAGCAPTFHGAIINGTAMQLEAIEYVNPSSKRLTFHDVEPYHVKTFQSTWPNADIRLFWKEGAEGNGQTYGVKVSPERLKEAAHGGDHVLLLRIEHEKGKEPAVLVGGVSEKDYAESLLQRRGDTYPAHLIER